MIYLTGDERKSDKAGDGVVPTALESGEKHVASTMCTREVRAGKQLDKAKRRSGPKLVRHGRA